MSGAFCQTTAVSTICQGCGKKIVSVTKLDTHPVHAPSCQQAGKWFSLDCFCEDCPTTCGPVVVDPGALQLDQQSVADLRMAINALESAAAARYNRRFHSGYLNDGSWVELERAVERLRARFGVA